MSDLRNPSASKEHLFIEGQSLSNAFMKKSRSGVRAFRAVFGLLLFANTLHAQQASTDLLPDAPQPQPPAAAGGATSNLQNNQQTRRILGVFPNFRAVSAQTHLPPQSVKEKFVTASQDSFDYSAFVLPALLAAEGEASASTPEFHSGGAGYGRYFWHTFVDQTDENYWVEFIVPTVTREDTRYYTMGQSGGGKLKRLGYSMSRIVVTRNDAGRDTFNVSEVVGAGAAAGVSSLYYPSKDRSFGNTATLWSTNVGVDAVSFVIREFWPDVNHALFHGKEGPSTVTTGP